ncbi:MAG: hypothetical protein SFV19_04310 [Rhodospirillaceae bacterium]|nr:hypothetical protein [Rhodospirillaceae bacterium]
MTTTRSPFRLPSPRLRRTSEPGKHGYSFREGLTMMAANGSGIDPYLAAEAGEDATLSLRALRHALTLPAGPERREALATAARELRNIDPGRHEELVAAIAARIAEAQGHRPDVRSGARTNPATGQQEFAIEEITVTGIRLPPTGPVRIGNSYFLQSAGPELGFLTGGFHLDLPASIANIARLSGVDIKIDENGDWTFQGRKIDDIAAEQGKTKSQVLTEIFQTEVIPALPPDSSGPRLAGTLPVIGGGGIPTGEERIEDVAIKISEEERQAFKDFVQNLTNDAFTPDQLDMIVDSIAKNFRYLQDGWHFRNGFDANAQPLNLTDGQGRVVNRLINGFPTELRATALEQLRRSIMDGRVICATCLGESP